MPHITRTAGSLLAIALVFAAPAAPALGASARASASAPKVTPVDHTLPRWGHFGSVSPKELQPTPDRALPALGPHIAGTTNTLESSNWSGLIDFGAQYSHVAGQWIVPPIQPSSTLAATSSWIGIDGATNLSLIQTGTAEQTINDVNTYFAWYEILPSAAIPIGLVNPGDVMSASVTQNSPGLWTISITDVTENQSYSDQFAYSGPGATAEWIEEDPTINGGEPQLANFGTAHFSGMAISGTNLASNAVNPVDMVDSGGNVIAYPANITASAFTVSYGAPPPPPPPLSIATTTLPSVDVNSPYAQTLSAQSGTAPYTWSITGGTLPSGLALNDSTGALSGTPTAPGRSNVTFLVTDANHATASATLTIAVVSPDPYSPLAPVRICDTRGGNPSGLSPPASQCNGSTIAAGGALSVNVAGNFGVPANAAAVVLNVTVVGPAGPGFITAYPTGASRPTASNINYVANKTVPNLVEVGIGNGGDVSFYSSNASDLIVDVEGYTSPTASGGSGSGLYTGLATPSRICDTRAANPSNLNTAPNNQCNGLADQGDTLPAGTTRNVEVAGGGGAVPAGATAAVLNVTAVNPAASGYFTVFPQDAARPTASNVNYVSGQVASNRVIVPLSSSGDSPGDISVYSSASADLIVDVSGYYSASGGTGSQFSAEGAPIRICDTRSGNPSNLVAPDTQCNGAPLTVGATKTIAVKTLAGVPSSATAVVINLTGVTPTNPTFLTVFPGPALPSSSDLNPGAGQVMANMVVATVNANGTISIYNHTGSINAVADVMGWYS